MLDEDGRPFLEATATWTPSNFARGGYWKLETAGCPYCKKRSHQHGGQSKPIPTGGHRVSHCANPVVDDSKGYVLVVTKITNFDFYKDWIKRQAEWAKKQKEKQETLTREQRNA